LERELVRAVLSNEALVALTGDERPARVALLDRVDDLLVHNRCRVVRVASPDGLPLDLQRAMDQVVGRGQSGADRVERFFETIALPVADEYRIVLILDDAEQLTTELLSYLALIGPTTVGQDLCLQIVFAGATAMWDRLPKSGNFASERITVRFALEPAALPAPKPEPLPAVSLRPRRLPPTEGHELLRQRLAGEERRRQKRQRFTGPIVGKLKVGAILALAGAVSVALWMHMPELRVAVRGFVASSITDRTGDSQTVAALLARANRLLGAGDVLAAQNVFAHAASSGSAPAATGLAKTYDPAFLAEIGARATSPDIAIATAWYQRAVVMGDGEAADRLSRMRASARK
jgi:hypothetical protein